MQGAQIRSWGDEWCGAGSDQEHGDGSVLSACCSVWMCVYIRAGFLSQLPEGNAIDFRRVGAGWGPLCICCIHRKLFTKPFWTLLVEKQWPDPILIYKLRQFGWDYPV